MDDYFDQPAPDASRGNALGLARQGIAQFANAQHCTNAAGQYRHAICIMREEAPRPELLFPVDGMLLMGWRSRITQLVDEAQKHAERAAPRAATLLADQQGRIVLTDASGNIMATDSIQFRETLFAFQLGRNKHLDQLAEPPRTAPDGAQEAAAAEATRDAGNRHLAMQVQAQAILELNKIYVQLRLHMPSPEMPSVSRTDAKETELRRGKRTDMPAPFAEVQALFAETEKLLERIMETEKDLVQHWFLNELERLLRGMSRSLARIESKMSDA